MHPAGISSNISPYGLPTAPNVYICPMPPRTTALCFLPSSVPQAAGAQLPTATSDTFCLAYAAQPHLVPPPIPAGCSPELCSVAAREHILSIGRTVLPFFIPCRQDAVCSTPPAGLLRIRLQSAFIPSRPPAAPVAIKTAERVG